MNIGAMLDSELRQIRNWVGMRGDQIVYTGDPLSIESRVSNLEVQVYEINKTIQWIQATHPQVLAEYKAVQDLKASCEEI